MSTGSSSSSNQNDRKCLGHLITARRLSCAKPKLRGPRVTEVPCRLVSIRRGPSVSPCKHFGTQDYLLYNYIFGKRKLAILRQVDRLTEHCKKKKS